jgi:competence protein ComEA
MPSNFARDYLSFTKKERIGIITLVTLILSVYFLPQLFPKNDVKPTAKEISAFQELANELEDEDSEKSNKPGMATLTNPVPVVDTREKPTVFNFDPNTIGVEDWKRLGIRARTAETIRRYISKGGQFKKPEDLEKIYGLRHEDFLRLEPYVRITANIPTIFTEKEKPYHARDTPFVTQAAVRKISVVELNTADTAALINLPGIGPTLARRIIHFRDRLGGFYNIDQVKETYGVSGSTFNIIKPYLILGNKPVNHININLADAATLKQHPYFTWAMANALVQYREQHGPFQHLEDLSAINAILPDQLKRLIPYLSIY